MLIPCPECKQQISDQAVSCPKCARPISSQDREKAQATAKASQNVAKGCGIGCLALVVIAILMALFAGHNTSNRTPSAATESVLADLPGIVRSQKIPGTPVGNEFRDPIGFFITQYSVSGLEEFEVWRLAAGGPPVVITANFPAPNDSQYSAMRRLGFAGTESLVKDAPALLTYEAAPFSELNLFRNWRDGTFTGFWAATPEGVAKMDAVFEAKWEAPAKRPAKKKHPAKKGRRR